MTAAENKKDLLFATCHGIRFDGKQHFYPGLLIRRRNTKITSMYVNQNHFLRGGRCGAEDKLPLGTPMSYVAAPVQDPAPVLVVESEHSCLPRPSHSASHPAARHSFLGADDGSSTLDPAPHGAEADGGLGSWFQPGPALATVVFGE